jgi:hypothetical protein
MGGQCENLAALKRKYLQYRLTLCALTLYSETFSEDGFGEIQRGVSLDLVHVSMSAAWMTVMRS